jgi:hypothetical protein
MRKSMRNAPFLWIDGWTPPAWLVFPMSLGDQHLPKRHTARFGSSII